MAGSNSAAGQRSLTIGVLGVQGGFAEHISHLEKLKQIISKNNKVVDSGATNFSVVQIRTAAQLDGIDALVIPGGETTTMSVFLKQNNSELLLALRRFCMQKPVFGTCAGLIMLANEVEGQMKMGQEFIGSLDIKVRRNYYGSQTQSFQGQLTLEVDDIGDDGIKTIFIRAPGILDFDSSRVKVLAKFNNLPVAIQQNNLLATSFHPELTESLAWHLYFLKMVFNHAQTKQN